MSPSPDELSRIDSTIELADGLALIFVVGPDFRAEEGLSLVRSRLPKSRPVLWHRLDRDGPDLVSAIQESGLAEPILLAHGLEYLEGEERATTEASMNMLRDQLVAARAAIILWIPQSGLEAFQRHCADLFAWRSLLVSLTEEQVPVEPNVEARRIYLSQLGAELKKLIADQFIFMPVQPDALSERLVRPDNSQVSIPLFQWVQETPAGLLLGEAGSGKSAALEALALRCAREALDGGQDALWPLLVTAHQVYAGPLYGLQLDEADFPRNTLSGGRFRFNEARAEWARSGNLLLLLDNIDDIGRDELDDIGRDVHRLFVQWLERLRERYPRLRVIVATRLEFEEFKAPWQRARLVPLSLSEWEHHPGLMPVGRQRNALQAGLRRLEVLPKLSGIASPLLLQAIHHTMSSESFSVLPPAALLDKAITHLLRLSEIRIGFPPSRPHARALKLVMPFLAFRTLGANTRSFSPEGFWDALTSMPQRPGLPPLSPIVRRRRGSILRFAKEHAWLFTETGHGQFCFTYPLFEAFFAAEWVAEQGPADAAALLVPHVDQPEWRALPPLVAAILARKDSTPALLFLAQFLQGPEPSSVEGMRRLALALDSARAAQFSPKHTQEWQALAEELCRAHVHSQEEQSAVEELRKALDQLQARFRETPDRAGR